MENNRKTLWKSKKKTEGAVYEKMPSREQNFVGKGGGDHHRGCLRPIPRKGGNGSVIAPRKDLTQPSKNGGGYSQTDCWRIILLGGTNSLGSSFHLGGRGFGK